MNTHWRIRIFISPSHIASSYAPKRGSCAIRHKSILLRHYVTRVSLVFLFFPLSLSSAAEHTFRLQLAQDLKSRLNANVLIVQPVHYAILMLKYKYWNCIHRYKNKINMINIINLLYFRLLSHKSPQISNSILI